MSRTPPMRQRLLDRFRKGVEQLHAHPYSGVGPPDLTPLPVRFKLVAGEWWLVYRPEPLLIIACIRTGTPLGGLLDDR